MASSKELKALIILAGKVDPSLGAATQKASSKISQLSSKASKISSFASKTMGKIGSLAITGAKTLAVGAAGGAAALGGLLVKATETGDNLLKLRDKTGLTLDQLQKLQYVTNQVGADFESLPSAINILTKNMAAAKSGSKETATAFKSLKVDVTDATKKLRPQSQVFQETLMKLSSMKNQTERNALAFKVFGKGASGLFPILNAGSKEVSRLSNEAQRLGLVMSDKQVETLDNMGDTIDRIKLAAKGIGNQLIGGLAPSIQPILDKVLNKMPQINKAVSKIGSEFFGSIMNIVPGILDIMGKVGPSVSKTFKGLVSAIQPLLPKAASLVKEVLPKMADILNKVFVAAQPLAGALLQIGSDLLPPVLDIIDQMMPMIQKLTPLVAKIAVIIGQTLAEALRTVTPILKAVFDIVSGVIDGLTWIVDNVGKVGSFFGQIGNALAGKPMKHIPVGPNSPFGGLPRYANGGIARSIGITGDGPDPEMNIPLRRTSRNLGLLKQTANILGVGGGTTLQVIQYISGENAKEIAKQSAAGIKGALEDVFGEKVRLSYG